MTTVNMLGCYFNVFPKSFSESGCPIAKRHRSIAASNRAALKRGESPKTQTLSERSDITDTKEKTREDIFAGQNRPSGTFKEITNFYTCSCKNTYPFFAFLSIF